jgi:hypothetical protein
MLRTLLLCLLYQTVFPELHTFAVGILNEIMTYAKGSGSVIGLSMEVIAKDGMVEFSSFDFQQVF